MDYKGFSKLFLLQEIKNKYFIAAEKIMYQENNLPVHETSIPSKKEKLFDKETLLSLMNKAKTQGTASLMEVINPNNWIEIK